MDLVFRHFYSNQILSHFFHFLILSSLFGIWRQFDLIWAFWYSLCKYLPAEYLKLCPICGVFPGEVARSLRPKSDPHPLNMSHILFKFYFLA